MRYISLFSGVEAATLAWESLGWEPVAFCEIDSFPSAVLAYRWPNVPNLGDITKVDWSPYKDKVDLVVGGSPCFVAGTLVLCEDGFKPIEEVQVGERVVTHRGNLKHVLSTGSKVADTIMLRGQGSVGIECTPNHPFFSRTKRKLWNNDKREYKMVVESGTAWTDAKDMQGRFWLNVCNVSATDIPPFGKYGKGERGCGYIEKFEFTSDFFYFVGRWLGDGWANEHARKNRVKSLMKRVCVCCSHDEGDELEEKLNSTGLHFGRVNNGSTERFTCSSTQLYDWIISNFGVHADGKNIPAWCLGMPESFRKAMLDGYLDADGTVYSGGYKSTTVNRKLALGIKALAGSCGMTTSITYTENNRDAVIEGRHINERPTYVSTHYKKPRSAFFADGGYYGLVRSVSECSSNVIVYNLEVEDDNSYTADGIAVHNCQSFSVAGGRESLDGESRLMFEYIRAVGEIHPRWIVWENVPGVFSVKDGAFDQLITSLQDLGYVSLAWRVLDAQFFGVAQRRRRVFLVGHLGAGGGAAAVLFERESVSGNTQTSKQKRQALAADARGGPADTGGVTAFAQNTRDEVRVQGDVTISGALSAQPGMKQTTYVAQPVSLTQYGEEVAGTLTARHDSSPCADRGQNVVVAQNSNGEDEAQNIQPVVMASDHYNAEIGEEGVVPTLLSHMQKGAPVLAMGRTCSHCSTQTTETSSSSTTSQSTVVGSCSTQDGSGLEPICAADDNAHAAIDENLSGSLKVGGGTPFVAFRLTDRK